MDAIRIAEQLDTGHLTPEGLGAQYSVFLADYKRITGGEYKPAIKLNYQTETEVQDDHKQ